MINIIENTPPNIAAFVAKGEVNQDDFDKVFEEVRKVIRKEDELNYLLKLDTSVKNFSLGAWIQDIWLGIKHLTKWNRCAIVTDDDMVKEVTEITNKLAIAEFKTFKKKELEKAIQWTSTGEMNPSNSGIKKLAAGLVAGLAGAVALNIVHEVVRRNFEDVPAVNEIGEEVIDKTIKNTSINLNSDQKYYAALAGDLVSNTFYYASTATNNVGILSGIAAGIGTVELPKYMGLNGKPVDATPRKKLLTIAYYTFGALVTNLVYKKIAKK